MRGGQEEEVYYPLIEFESEKLKNIKYQLSEILFLLTSPLSKENSFFLKHNNENHKPFFYNLDGVTSNAELEIQAPKFLLKTFKPRDNLDKPIDGSSIFNNNSRIEGEIKEKTIMQVGGILEKLYQLIKDITPKEITNNDKELLKKHCGYNCGYIAEPLECADVEPMIDYKQMKLRIIVRKKGVFVRKSNFVRKLIQLAQPESSFDFIKRTISGVKNPLSGAGGKRTKKRRKSKKNTRTRRNKKIR